MTERLYLLITGLLSRDLLYKLLDSQCWGPLQAFCPILILVAHVIPSKDDSLALRRLTTFFSLNVISIMLPFNYHKPIIHLICLTDFGHYPFNLEHHTVNFKRMGC